MSKLMYQRPRPENYNGHKALHDLQESESIFREYLDDPDRVLDRYDLDDEMRSLIRNADYRGLVERGIHAVMVVQFQRRIEWGMSLAKAEE
jgi:hypothetical protein